jgi:type II secretory pathway component PulF
MPVFIYKAKNTKNEMIDGMVDAASSDIVANLLTEKKWNIISISEKNIANPDLSMLAIFNRVRSKDLVIFFRQLSVMVKANLPIVRALHILVKQTENKSLRLVIANVANEIDGGAKLSVAMTKSSHVFSNFYSNVIASGETSGRLGDVVDYIADQQEKDYDLQSKIKGAMIYPAFILSGLFVIGMIMMTWVIPQMTTMLTEAGAELPFLTQILISASDIFVIFWWLIILVVVGGIGFLVYFFKKVEIGKKFLDQVKINMPVFGKILRKVYIVRIFRSFSTLLKGGVPIAQALETVKGVVSNSIYKDIIDDAILAVEEGNSVSESFATYEEVPIMVSQMMSIGEETGRLDEIIDRMIDFYSREIDTSVANISTLIEPIIMVILGIAIGGFVAAIIMPMWQLSSTF